MKANLRSLRTSDGEPLASFQPSDPADFAIGVRAMIGPQDGPGEESFDVLVVAPRWLAAHPAEKGFRWGRSLLILDRWDPARVDRAISDVVRRTEGSTWSELAARLAGFADWEFENYVE